MKTLTTTALVTLAAASSAFAGGADRITGFSAGMQAGYVSPNHSVDTAANTSVDLGGNGGMVGLTLAYDKLFPNKMFMGLGVHGDLTNAKGETIVRSSSAVGVNTVVYTVAEAKQKSALGVNVRLGYMFGNVAPYLFAGYVNGKFDVKNVGTGQVLLSKSLSGFQAGLGSEIMMNPKWSVAGEYKFASYKSENYTSTASVRPQTHQVALKLNYKF